MFCEKCGAQLPDDAKFCEKCGSSTIPGAAPAPAAAAVAAAAAPAAPKEPSAFALALKKFFSNKRNVVIAAVALLLIIAIIVAVIIIVNQPKKIYIDDYFHVVFEGVDGTGHAYLSVSEEESEKMNKLSKKLFGNDEDEHIGKYITPYIDMTEEELHTLKNGQKIKVKLKIDKEIYDELDGKYKFVLRHKSVKVKGLYTSTQLNVLDYITPVFGGYTGYGMPQCLDTLVFPLINGLEARVTHQSHRLNIEIYDSAKDSYVTNVHAMFDRHERLSNGDSVSLSIDASSYDTSSLYSGYGIILASQTRAYTVEGLDEPIYSKLETYVTPKFTGISTVAKMNFEVPSDEIKIEGFRVKLYNYNADYEYSSELRVELYNSKGENLRNFTYYANKCDKIKNGDKITFETGASVEAILTSYGIFFPQSFEIEASGLTEPFDTDPFSRGTHSFTGYEGYGSFAFELPEENRVYKSEDEKYTIKLTYTKDNDYYKITVVVADETGRNFISFYYYTYIGSYLRNGNTINFGCSLGSWERENYVRDYGLYFPEGATYTVEGLAETTKVQPLDKLTFAFEKDGDYVKMTLGLSENVITVGENTVNLALETYSSWGYKYTKINLTVKDKDGKVIGKGYYQFQVDHLYEGNDYYASSNITDADAIAKATGIIFDTDSFKVIASAM